MMESAAAHPEPAIDQDDIPYPCKGCGEILEEGKAFELAGNRWHIDCFRCATCGTLLDSDAHLLLLGDGSLICSKCTYSCSSCGEKIEDLAILTGDQAYCSNCFRCRNCKKKIENLRYARTSQGIFCMECHETLMQRRRKRKGASNRKQSAAAKLDKSLPSLPPTAAESSAPSATRDRSATEPYTGASDLPAQNRSATARDDTLLPSNSYRNNRHSTVIPADPDADGAGEFLIPVAFDPFSEQRPSPPDRQTSSDSTKTHDYFGRISSIKSPPPDSVQQGHISRTTSASGRSPHIAYQTKDREDNHDDPSGVAGKTQQLADIVKSQSASSKNGRLASARSSRSDLQPINSRENHTPFSARSPESAKSISTPFKDFGSADSRKRTTLEDSAPVSRMSLDSAWSLSSPKVSAQYPPKRGDSLESKPQQQPSQRREISPQKTQLPNRAADGNASITSRLREDPSQDVRKHRARNDSLSALEGVSLQDQPVREDRQGSPSLLQYSPGGISAADDDMKILGSDDLMVGQNSESFLRRVSNSVRHGRSLSDRGGRLTKDTRGTKTSFNGGASTQDVSSPVSPSFSEHFRDEIAWLRSELQRERQRVMEREQRIAEVEGQLNASTNVQQAKTELDEKRSTMVVLDAQREFVLRELGILSDHLEAEKRGSESATMLDLGKITNPVLREFIDSIHRLKESYSPQIQELIQKRNVAALELTNVNRLKEKSLQEFELLTSRNAQLADLNNQLVHQIQELYKANAGTGGDGNRGANGLGIHGHNKSVDLVPSVSASHVSEDGEPATILPGPQVVSIRKGQPRKFNWKRGGQNVAKGVTKGIKGAFMSSEPRETVPYSSTTATPLIAQDGGYGLSRAQLQDPNRQAFGLFGNQRSRQGTPKVSSQDSAGDAVPAAPALFGAELEQRMKHEKCIVPAVVSKCVQEVELRGMNIEGIYRKSGASSLVQNIRDGFEQCPESCDISDPDLDIHAVTSALKQYFRRLPTPLITYDVYEKIIDSGEISSQSARIEHLQKSLRGLPRVHRDVLEFLLFHLKRVVEHERENLMNSQNVAVVFAPTIMRPESIAREMTDVQKKNEVLKYLVENCRQVFNGMHD